jgi:hypothetical protein
MQRTMAPGAKRILRKRALSWSTGIPFLEQVPSILCQSNNRSGPWYASEMQHGFDPKVFFLTMDSKTSNRNRMINGPSNIIFWTSPSISLVRSANFCWPNRSRDFTKIFIVEQSHIFIQMFILISFYALVFLEKSWKIFKEFGGHFKDSCHTALQ